MKSEIHNGKLFLEGKEIQINEFTIFRGNWASRIAYLLLQSEQIKV